jgi:hypothetical protein
MINPLIKIKIKKTVREVQFCLGMRIDTVEIRFVKGS